MTKMMQTISPIDNSIYVERPYTTFSETEKVSTQSKTAQLSWQQSSLEQRAEICSKAIDYFLQHKSEIAAEICTQMGRPLQYCPGEINGLEERGRHLIAIAKEALADLTPEANPGFTRFVRREPLGVVLIIAPWNYPYLTAVNSIIPAIMSGNAVILKHSSQTPLCAERFAKAFEYAGLPKDVFQFIHCSHEVTSQLIESRAIDFIAFTGSVNAGANIEKLTAGQFIGRGLELGGKDPAYVRADADIAYSVEQLVDGAFFNSGQSCCGIERIYVHHSLHDDFLDRYVNLVSQYKLGNPKDPSTTLGPLVKPSAAKFVKKQIDQAISQGATAHIDPALFPLAKDGTPYLAPQVLSKVTHEMAVMKDESFGPVVGIMSVNDDDEAIALMNDSEFGLTASIWTQNEEAALALGARIETGTVFMNRCDYLDPALVWTGVKNTGHGYSLSQYGYHQLTRLKSYHLKSLHL